MDKQQKTEEPHPESSYYGRRDKEHPNDPDHPTLGSNPSLQYICADCYSECKIDLTLIIRCEECGHRVLYKKRPLPSMLAIFFKRPFDLDIVTETDYLGRPFGLGKNQTIQS
ncbi:hypothetical protein C8J56DRAFT_1021064 [Mycena floridula]|nr:hypothetical protein C8J56DRAFT_1021064 [Mycena floridula]